MSKRASTRLLGSTLELLRPAASTSRQPLQLPAYRYNSTSAAAAKQPARPVTTSQPPNALPTLPRPLGVSSPPNTQSKTWKEKKAELLDEERHKAKRKALVREATQGYFHDYNLMKKANGGKLWVAPPVLIREDRALYFPDITGKSLLTRGTVHTTDLLQGKSTLVTILNTRISEEQALRFVQPTLEDWEGQPGFQYVQINHQPNPLKSMLLQLFMSSLKRTIPENRWEGYMVSGGEWGDIKEPLGIENKMLGYVYLVDADCKVRWAGCGMANEEETANLRRATAVLMGRMNGTSGMGTTGKEV